MFSLKKHAILFLPCLLTLMSGCVPEIEDLDVVTEEALESNCRLSDPALENAIGVGASSSVASLDAQEAFRLADYWPVSSIGQVNNVRVTNNKFTTPDGSKIQFIVTSEDNSVFTSQWINASEDKEAYCFELAEYLTADQRRNPRISIRFDKNGSEIRGFSYIIMSEEITEEEIIDEEVTDDDIVTIDFSPATLPGGSRCENAPFTREGYLFSPAQNCGFAIANLDDTNNVWLNLAYAGIGSSLSAANNQKFTVYSMDIAEYSTVFAYEQTLVITCVKDGMQNFVDITLDGVITDSNDKFQTFDLSDSCSDIDELWFDAPMGVDNIRLSKLVSETKGIEATR
ncbi:MAG: hypothetical protein HRU21_11070 [Pseudomonadales bacterium]|nr:hypothetical protein [Pseudomonadales bacterium]